MPFLPFPFFLCCCWISGGEHVWRQASNPDQKNLNHKKQCFWFPPPFRDKFACVLWIREWWCAGLQIAKEVMGSRSLFSRKWNGIKARGRRNKRGVGKLWKSPSLPGWVAEQPLNKQLGPQLQCKNERKMRGGRWRAAATCWKCRRGRRGQVSTQDNFRHEMYN